MNATAVAGHGFLADTLTALLAEDPAADADAGGDVVLVAELNSLGDYHDVVLDSLNSGRPMLFVGAWRSYVYIGPYWAPGRPGCAHCLASRTANSPFGPDLDRDRLVEASARDIDVCPLGPALIGTVGRLVRDRLAHPTAEPTRVTVVDGVTGAVESRQLLPDSTCPVCGVSDTPTVPAFTDPGTPLTKMAPATLRTAELDAEAIERDYLFAGPGLFKEVRQDLQSPFGACSVELSTRWGRREPAIGRARTYRSSRTVAVLEGLERYAGLHRGGPAARLRAAYADIADQALYPPLLGSHPAESYRTPGFRYRPFDPSTVVDWVWAYSFRLRDRILVPERAAYWGPRHDDEVSFHYDTSNGCALGNSVEEAVLHGLREVAERDSFLLAWYRRLALPEVDLGGAEGVLADLLAKARLFTGFTFRCFESTMEYGMPSFWLVAENTAATGPATFAGSGAHPDPAQAIIGGLYELVGTILATAHSYPERQASARPMLDDPALIRRMEDHSLVGALPEARPRFSFLLDTPPRRIPLAEVDGTVRRDASDLRADLRIAVDGMLGCGLDVLVVDQSMPELRRNHLRCARVLVPGLVPMTFGHVNRRTAGLPRLIEGTGVPYHSMLPAGEVIGCVPHPFP